MAAIYLFSEALTPHQEMTNIDFYPLLYNLQSSSIPPYNSTLQTQFFHKIPEQA